ncbi:class I adenylate-forming enzyme family protein [Mycobacterium shimoidei]|uniref:AMP-dependent acyl-CoA synthetase/AMP-acid ligases II [Amycolatopsis mediterranei S699] n=1 Tax=Mycobacterium shimoidei TaxID=29313 RepID=A0A1E3TKG8_MYCSH|nr:class I adenylate-forming enzyme family protein [Mycobacterium shimoidei]MCV7260012.1 acyl--CoA ligase [Mycobacterium shimoidei]ODR14956.1 AMP-dependent synthetase [Mycobacterium shimoidei]ORW79124.1 AMP-dependent synthetase [Mycobacterium shimoidei]SRX94425.1 AMP-dependent acyl-CoA synthetase/AMP-acid ligases II [Amycolatopsis mediterranei S699] [Mycobacterium shimoidei]
MSLAELLADLPDTAVHTLTVDVSRDELVASAGNLAAILAEAGLVTGQVVAAMLPNDATTVAALFGTWRAGGVYTPLNPRAPDTEVASQLATLRPVAVITTHELALRFSESRLPVVAGSNLMWSLSPSSELPPDRRQYDADVALLQFTSGTTGPPKPVPLRHATVLDLIDRLLAKLRGAKPTAAKANRTPMPNLVPLSLSLWAGIYQVLFAFRAGSGVVLMDRFLPTDFAALVKRHQLRSTVLPPAALTMVLHDESVTDLSPLKIVRSITAPLSPVHAGRFRDKFGVIVLNSYGQTELGGEVVGWSAADAREWGATKLGSVGRPLPGIDVTIADDEVLVRTPTTAARKIDPAFLDRLTDDGWFHTGDLGWFDEDGFLWLDGRVSDMINRGGLKVFPGAVEDVLLAAEGVREAAVVGIPDERLGEVPWAFVACNDPCVTEDDLIAWCRERLTPYRVPVRVVFVKQLPRNDVGKVVRRDLAVLADA